MLLICLVSDHDQVVARDCSPAAVGWPSGEVLKRGAG